MFGTIMRPWFSHVSAAVFVAAFGVEARAIPYRIVDLGTLPGTTSSVATSINNGGQVVGISYNDGDGVYAPVLRAHGDPGRFLQEGDGALSFRSDGASMSRINPTGGLALAINDGGEVVGGPYTSINGSGQYVGSPLSGIRPYWDQQAENPPVIGGGGAVPTVSVSGGASTDLPIIPYAVNDSGLIVGTKQYPPDSSVSHGLPDREKAFTGMYPVVLRDGQVSPLLFKPGTFPYVDHRAVDVNNRGDVLIVTHQQGIGFEIVNANTGAWLGGSPRGPGQMISATAINDVGQVVGNGFLYDDSTMKKLTDLLTSPGGWSDLNATDINDSGWIVGQGTIDGEQRAFLMTPIAPVPEPATVLSWAVLVGLGALRLRRASRS
jgi:uncharacterized membrane protein